jgi:hypothetical protein
LLLQCGRKILNGTRARQQVSRPAVEEEEGRDVSDATALPIVQIAQHVLQGLAARQAGRELPLVQPDIRRESPQRRVRIVARRSLLHPLEQQVVHGPELALIPGAFGPRESYCGDATS